MDTPMPFHHQNDGPEGDVYPAERSPLSGPPAHNILPTSPLTNPPPTLNLNSDDPILGTSFNSGLESSIDSSTPQGVYKDGVTKAQKLEVILDAIRTVGWSFPQFVRAWAGANTQDHTIDIPTHQLYRTGKQRRHLLNEVVNELVEDNVIPIPSLSEALFGSIMKELEGLLGDGDLFGQFKKEYQEDYLQIEKVDLRLAGQRVEGLAPVWFNLIKRLLINQRGDRESYIYTETESAKATMYRRVFTISSMVCYARACNRSNSFPTMVGLYLQGTGTRRRVYQTLAGLGLCPSFPQVNEMMEKVAKASQGRLRELGLNERSVFGYDNFNFKDTKRDKTVGHTATIRAITTGALYICPEIPVGGLLQSMHNPTIPLHIDDIFDSSAITGGNDIGETITRSLIADAIKLIHPDGVNVVFKNNEQLFPQMPELDVLTPRTTEYGQFGAIYEDEATVAGTYKVHEQIFLDQLRLNPKKDFKDRLYLVHGDQITAHHIRSTKKEQLRAELAYDRRDWLLGITGWFNIQMNLLLTIIRTHWAANRKQDEAHHCLFHDITVMGRSCTSRKNAKFYQVEPIIRQSFTARVTALFYAAMRRRRLFASSDSDFFDKPEHVDAVIKTLSPQDFLLLVEDVRQTAFTLAAWDGEQHSDIEFKTMCRMLQEIEMFLTLRHAIKFGDIGLLRRLVDPLIIYFLGASQYNYGQEMLHYRWLLSSVSTPELQRAILASGLVNTQGKRNTFKPIDLANEDLNGQIAMMMRSYRNSTPDIDIIFDRMCLANGWMGTLRQKIEQAFGEHMPSAHSTAAVVDDIFLLSRSLFLADLSEPRSDEHLKSFSSFFESADIMLKGVDLLEEKINALNKQHVRRPGVAVNAYPSLRAEPDAMDIREAEEPEEDDVFILDDI